MKLLKSYFSKFLTYSRSPRRYRDSRGHLVSFHRSTSTLRRHRVVDLFRFPVSGIPGYVRRIEYDPNRNVPICLVFYKNGIFSYILHFHGCRTGMEILNIAPFLKFHFGTTFLLSLKLSNGWSAPLFMFPTGSYGHCFQNGLGFSFPGIYARSCGSRGQILRFKGSRCLVRLKNGTLRSLPSIAMSIFGSTSKFNTRSFRLRKAGSSRRMGRRPHVRGVAKNPVDHPHGGGEGRSSGGRPSVSPWGFLTKCGFKKSTSKKI